jgi:hypothetical protein
MQVRSQPAVEQFFAGLDLVDPAWCRCPAGAPTPPASASPVMPPYPSTGASAAAGPVIVALWSGLFFSTGY